MYKNVGSDNENTIDINLCPLCGQSNACNNIAADKDKQTLCWCQEPSIQLSESLLNEIPLEFKNKSCICQSCVIAFNKSNS